MTTLDLFERVRKTRREIQRRAQLLERHNQRQAHYLRKIKTQARAKGMRAALREVDKLLALF